MSNPYTKPERMRVKTPKKSVPNAWYSRYDDFFKIACEYMPADGTALILGANDGMSHDPIRHIWKPSWRGVYAEPNPRAMEMLKKNITDEKAIFIPAAVGPMVGNLTLYSMTEEAAREYSKVMVADGSSLTSIRWDHIAQRIRRRIPHMLDDKKSEISVGKLIETITVPVTTIRNILDTCHVESVNLIQMDIEGMESTVMEEIIDLIKSKRINPHVLLYEHQHMPSNDKKSFSRLFHNMGYYHRSIRNDTLVWRDTWP